MLFNQRINDKGPGSINSLSIFTVTLLCGFLFCHTAALADRKTDLASFNGEQALAYSQAALQREIDNHRLLKRNGETIELDTFRGKPLVVSFIYTSCYHICPVITKNLFHAADIAEEALGEDAFNVLTIGFDSENDTPQRMAYFAKERGIEKGNWYFLGASQEVINSVSENFGFVFYPSSKGFDHMAQTSIVDAQGRLYRQVYGTEVDVIQLVEPLKELVFGNKSAKVLDLGQWINNIKLFCTIYDPSTGRYKFDYSIFLALIVGILCLASVVAFLLHSRRAGVKRSAR